MLKILLILLTSDSFIIFIAGAKEFEHVNVALVEMGGQLPVKGMNYS